MERAHDGAFMDVTAVARALSPVMSAEAQHTTMHAANHDGCVRAGSLIGNRTDSAP